ncbi:MAG: helix-turn-helix domain-containing protein [Saprospiraceae bacterium]
MVIIQLDSEQLDTVIQNAVRKVLEGMPQPGESSAAAETDQLLTVRQTADFLDLTPASIYGLVHAGKIPGACKRGKRLYFSKQELTDWVRAGRKQTAAELNAKAEQYAISQTKKTRG